MTENVENILKELKNIDTSNPKNIGLIGITKELDNTPKLIIKPHNEYEILYIKSLIKKFNIDKKDLNSIEVLLQLNRSLIGVGYLEFCYEHVIKILNYNPNIKLGVLINNKINEMEWKQILNLPMCINKKEV